MSHIIVIMLPSHKTTPEMRSPDLMGSTVHFQEHECLQTDQLFTGEKPKLSCYKTAEWEAIIIRRGLVDFSASRHLQDSIHSQGNCFPCFFLVSRLHPQVVEPLKTRTPYTSVSKTSFCSCHVPCTSPFSTMVTTIGLHLARWIQDFRGEGGLEE